MSPHRQARLCGGAIAKQALTRTQPPMPYATVNDLQGRLGVPRLTQLTDLSDPPVGLVDVAVAQQALDDAAAEIDGYLVGRYGLPLASVPAALRVHACTIAHYRLLGDSAGEVAREDYKAARDYLQRLADGRVSLTAPSETPVLAGAGAVLFNSGSKVMGREFGESWRGC